MKLYCKLTEDLKGNKEMQPIDYCFPSFSVDIRTGYKNSFEIKEGIIKIRDKYSLENFWNQIEDLNYDQVTSSIWYFEPMYFSNSLVPLEYIPQIWEDDLTFRINLVKNFIIRTDRATIKDLLRDSLGEDTFDSLSQLPESLRNKIV